MWCLEEVPWAKAQHVPCHGVPSPHWPLQSCLSSCPLRATQTPTFSAFTRSALTCCVTWDKRPASSQPQPSNLCNGAEEDWLVSGSLPGDSSVTLCPGLDLGVIWGGKHLG